MWNLFLLLLVLKHVQNILHSEFIFQNLHLFDNKQKTIIHHHYTNFNILILNNPETWNFIILLTYFKFLYLNLAFVPAKRKKDF